MLREGRRGKGGKLTALVKSLSNREGISFQESERWARSRST